MSNPQRRCPSATETLASFAPRPAVTRLAPPSAYGALLAAEAQEAADGATQIATHPIDTVGETYSRAFDMEAELFRETFAPFAQAPPPNPVGATAHYIGAVMGVLGLVEQFQYVGLAALSAPIAAIVPPQPCMTLTSMGLGIPHAHTHPPSLVPPAPPCPLPSLGAIALPGALSVLVGGLPAARAGDVGMILTCVSFGPPCEILLGSSNTFFGGSRAARIGTDIFFHDNPGELGAFAAFMMGVGMGAALVGAAGQASGGNYVAAGLSVAQAAADAAAVALKQLRKVDPGVPPDFGTILSGDFTVLVGGVPMPSAMSLADIVGAIKKGLASRAARRARAEGDEGAPSRAGAAEEGDVGGGTCPI